MGKKTVALIAAVLMVLLVGVVWAMTFNEDVLVNGNMEVTGHVFVHGGITNDGNQTVTNSLQVNGDNVTNILCGGSSPNCRMLFGQGVQLATSFPQATCDADRRGLLWLVPGNPGADDLQVCMRDNDGVYSWRSVWLRRQ